MLIESLEKKQFNFNSAEYPVQTKTIQKQENKIISIGEFGNDDKTSYHIYASKQTFKKHIDLFLYKVPKTLIMF